MHGKLVRFLRSSVAAPLTALAAVGCAARDASPWPEPSALGREIPAVRPAGEAFQAAERPPAVEEPVGHLTLRRALALALARNPALSAASWAVRAADGVAVQEGLVPNPEVRVTVDDLGGTGELEGTRFSEQTVRLSQVIELGDKAGKRRRTARLEAALCGWDYEAIRLDVLTETTKAFVAVLAAQKRLAAAEEMCEQAAFVLSLVTRRVQGGAGSDLEVDEAKIELGTSRVDLEQAKQALDAARGVLASRWDEQAPRFREAAGNLEDAPLAEIPPWERVLARIEGNPDVRRWETEVQVRRAALDREKAASVPDVRVLVGGRREEETGDYGYLFALEMSLPVFDRNQGGIREARANCTQAGYDHRAAVLLTVAALREAYKGLAGSHKEAALLRGEVLPAARRAVAASRRGLDGGALTDLQLLKAHRALFKARIRQIDALEVFHVSVADVERLIGQPVGTLSASGPRDSPSGRSAPVETSGEP